MHNIFETKNKYSQQSICTFTKHKILIEYFKNFSIFRRNQPEILAQLFTFKRIKRRVTLVQQGQLWNEIYIINSGALRFYYTTHDGKEFNKGFFGKDDTIWPIITSSRTKPSLFAIETLSDCDVWVASFTHFRKKMISLDLWEKFTMPLVEKMIEEKFIREYEFLVEDAESRYLSLQKRMGNIIEQITDYHIASYLGITSVALSRIKNKKLKIDKFCG